MQPFSLSLLMEKILLYTSRSSKILFYFVAFAYIVLIDILTRFKVYKNSVV